MAKAGDGYIYVGGDYRNTFPPLGVFRWHPETGDFQVYYNSWQSISVGGNGQSNDYNALANKPRINGKELKGNFTITAGDIGALSNTVKIPIKLSDLFNDSGFISETAIRSLVESIVSALRQEINNRNYLTQENDPTVADWAKKSNKPSYSYTEIIDTPDLNIYAKKSDTYTRQEIDNKTSAAYRPKGNVADYNSLPSSGNQPGDVWQLLDTGAEYYWTIDGEWAYFGEKIDLSAYAKKSEVEDALKDKANKNQITIINNSLAGKVDKEAGKSLVSDTEITRLSKVKNYDDTAIKQDIEDIKEEIENLDTGSDVDLSNYYTKDEIDNKKYLTTETDPTVPAWAKAANKPSYNYSEINNTPDLSGFALKNNTYTKEEVDNKTSAIYRPKGSVPNFESLPTSNNIVGDTYTVLDTGAEYTWTVDGTWEYLGEKIDLSAYAKKTELFSGSYNDLTDKPTIPSVAGLASETYVNNAVANKADKSTVETLQTTVNNKVEKKSGYSLVPDGEITRLSKVNNYDDTQVKADITALQKSVAAIQSDIDTIESDIDEALSEVE